MVESAAAAARDAVADGAENMNKERAFRQSTGRDEEFRRHTGARPRASATRALVRKSVASGATGMVFTRSHRKE